MNGKVKGSEVMDFNNRNRTQTSVYGCSSTSLIVVLIIISLMIFGGLFFILRYFGLIIALGLVVWIFRKVFGQNTTDTQTKKQGSRTQTWSRDFEQNADTPYDNIEREFEEVDDEDGNPR